MRKQNKRKTLNLCTPIEYFDFHEIDLRKYIMRGEMSKLKGKSPNFVSYLSKKVKLKKKQWRKKTINMIYYTH